MNPAIQTAVNNLLIRGHRRGFVTSAEIRVELVRLAQPVDQLEEAVQAVRAGGVRVLMEPSKLPPLGNQPALSGVSDPFTMYIRSIGRVPLLSFQQEVELAVAIEEGRIAWDSLQESGQDWSPRQRRVLLHKIEEGHQAAARMVEANLRLVVKIAQEYRPPGAGLLDLVQDGNLGLMKAVERFDYRRGYKFSTYAAWWIRQAVNKGLDSHLRSVRLPTHMSELARNFRNARTILYQRLGRSPTIKEMSDEIGEEFHKVKLVNEVLAEGLSLDSELESDSESKTTLGESLPDRQTRSPAHLAVRVLMEDRVALALECLSKREREVILYRFGLADGNPLSLKEVARNTKVTPERIRQIEIRALQKLRENGQYIHELGLFLEDDGW